MASLVVAGLALSVALSLLEWRRAESALRVELAQAATRAARDLGHILPLLRTEGTLAREATEELLRVHATGGVIVGVRLVQPGGFTALGGRWPAADSETQRVVLLPDGTLSADTIALDRPLLIDQPSSLGQLTLVLDAPRAVEQKWSQLVERLAVRWLIVGVLTLLALLLIRRWVGEPLADLAGLIGASASGDTLAALARNQPGDVGRLAGAMAGLLHRLEAQNRDIARREREFADLYERAPAAMLSYSLDGIITQANSAAEVLMDEGGVPLSRRRVIDLVQAEDRGVLEEVNRRLRYVDTARCRLRLRAGLSRPAIEVALEAVAVRDVEGELESIRLSISDVTGASRVREQLFERAEVLRVVLDQVPEAILMVDDRGRVVAANRHMLALLRRDRVSVEGSTRLDQTGFWEGLNLLDAQGWAARVRQIAAEPDRAVQERLPTVDGALLVRTSPVHDPATAMRGRVWILQDATGEEHRERVKGQQKRRLESLRGVGAALSDVRDVEALFERSLVELRSVLHADTVGIAVRGQQASRRTRQLFHSGSGSVLLMPGRGLVEAVQCELFPRLAAQQEVLHWPDLDAQEARWAAGFRAAGLTSLAVGPITSGLQLHGILWVGQRGGVAIPHETLDLLETLCPLLAVRLEAVQMGERLQGLHLVDPVTELPSALQFDRAMHTLLGRAGESAAILVLDLDRFEPLNKVHGRQACDAVLRQVAARLLGASRRTCFVARFAGPAFGIIVTEAGREQALHVAERLRRVVGESPLRLPTGEPVRLTASVGVAAWPEDHLRPDELLDLALMRLGVAKRTGRDRVVAMDDPPLLQAG